MENALRGLCAHEHVANEQEKAFQFDFFRKSAETQKRKYQDGKEIAERELPQS